VRERPSLFAAAHSRGTASLLARRRRHRYGPSRLAWSAERASSSV
jgi:hypothetical protein